MARPPAITPEMELAELLRLRKQSAFNSGVGLIKSPMREHLRKVGLLEACLNRGRPIPNRYRLTAAANTRLRDVAGSGIRTSPFGPL